MASARDIKRKINSVSNTQKITKTMKMVSAAKMRKAVEAMQSARPYSAKLAELIQELSNRAGGSSDHAFFEAKEEVKKHLVNEGYDVIDVGTNTTDSCNYAEFGIEAAKKVSSGEATYGVVICSSGEGISIAANKVKGVRCGIGYNDDVAHLLKEHNNANMIAFGAKFMSTQDIINRIDIFLNAKFEGGRHINRVNTIINEENK